MALDKNDLLSLVATELPDNIVESILPVNVRTVNSQMISSSANLIEPASQTFTGPVTFSGGVTGVGVIANRTVINQYSDFPDPLLPETQYYIGGEITLPTILPASWVAMPDNVEFAGTNVSSKLTWDGTGTLFGGGDLGRFRVRGVIIDAPAATLFNFVDVSGVSLINLIEVAVVSCTTIGTINTFGLLIESGVVTDADQGITTGAKNEVISAQRYSVTSTDAGFIGLDITLSTILSTLETGNNKVNAPAGAIGLKGLAGSANIVANKRANILSNEFVGGVTPLSGISADDFRYRFEGNQTIRDTNPDAMITLTSNVTNTTIAGSSTDGTNAVLVAGTWVEKSASQYATTAAGRITALFEREIPSPITASLTIEPVSGTNKVLAVYISVDGVVEVSSRAHIKVDAGDPKQITVVWQEKMSSTANVYVELFAENQTDAVDVLVSGAVLRVR